ncbi:MAG: CCA tRNA nucleotidyltransferase [Alphaproteobacteria bacterium]
MSAVGQLGPQPWMTAAPTRAVIAALTADGAKVRFVGGCVRDAVLKRAIRDVDIATADPPATVIALLERAGIRAIPTGIAHGTVTAMVGDSSFEITTLRRDVACDGRHAEVSFTDDWKEDAARRDFTINTLSAAPDGVIHDYFGGLRDLGEGRVRFVGNARRRIEEDVLRLLRFFRFNAFYGRPPPDVDALAACRLLAPRIATLSAERVRDEMLKILMAPDPAGVLLLMRGERVLEHVLPEAADFGRLRLLAWFEDRGIRIEGVTSDPLRRLAAVLTVDAAGAAAVAARLRLSNREAERLASLAEPPGDLMPTPGMDPRTARRALRRLGPERFRDLILLSWAGRKAVHSRTPPTETDSWLALLELARAWTPPVLPVQGRDVLAAGVPPGPAVGVLLARLDRWWEEGDYRASRDEALARLQALMAEEES